jgi:Tfp pilus assembly protein PilF
MATVSLVLAFIVTGCATDASFRQKQAREARDLGERYLARDDTGRALEQFYKALELHPEDPYLHYDLALAYDMKGALDKAEYHLKKAVALKPDYSDAYNYLGVVYFRQGKVCQAIKAYHKALENLLYLNPQDAHLNLGIAYLSGKEYQKAEVHLEEDIRLVPDFVVAYNYLGQVYEGMDQYLKAKASYKRAIEYNPEYADAYLNLGKLYYRSGERQKAIRAFDKVVRLEPGSEKGEQARRYLKALR